jgi:hypothetical protein
VSRTADFQTSTWTDPWFQQLPPHAKLLFLYLWTNSHRELSGIYSISPQTMAQETGIAEDLMAGLLSRLYPKVYYDKDKYVVFVVNMVRHQFMRGEVLSPTVRAGIRASIRQKAPRAHQFIEKFFEAYPNIMAVDEYPYVLEAEPEQKVTRRTAKPKDHDANERYVQWWATYPRKDTGPKAPYRYWPHPMSDDLFGTILAKLAEFIASDQWKDPEKIPMATTWLNQRRWEGQVLRNSGGGKAANALPAKPGKYANLGERVQTDG